MSDSKFNIFLAADTAAVRGALTPDPPTPAAGPAQGYIFFETDTGNVYGWNQGTPGWQLLISASGGLLAANNLSDLTSVSSAQTNLGISAFVATLLDDAAATNFLTTLGVSSFVKTILDDADAAAVQTTLGLVPGTNVQAFDADLSALAALSGTNTIYYRSAANTWTAVTIGTGLSFSAGSLVATGSGALDVATAAQYRANTADKLLDTDGVWSAAAPVALTDAATVAVDLSAGFNFTVTLGGNRTLGNPSNVKDQSGYIAITQDGTGSRTLAYGANWEFAGGIAPTLSTAAGTKDMLFYQVLGASSIFANLIKAVA